MQNVRWAARAAALAFVLSIAWLCRREVGAGSAVKLDLDGLASRSDLVIEGRVIAARALRDAHGKVATEYTLDVLRTYLGEPFGARSFRLPGGTMPDGSGTLVPGVPRVDVGEDAILFLTRESTSGLRMPVGLAQGKLRVVREAGSPPRLARDTGDLVLLDPVTGAATPAAGEADIDYAEFVRALERAVARTKAERAARGEGSGR